MEFINFIENTDKKTTPVGVENLKGKTFLRLRRKLKLVSYLYFLFNFMIFIGVKYFNSKNMITLCID